MKKALLSHFLFLLAFLSFAQATKTSLGLGFPDPGGWYSATPPAAITAITVANGNLVFTCDSLNQYAPLNYRLNDGVAGNKDSVNFSATNKAYAAVWASATNPVALRIDFLNSSNPGCLCPQDRAANKSAQKTTAVGTSLQGYLQPAVTDWNEAYTTNAGPVDNSSITHINIYVVPQVPGAVNYSGTVTIDSIFISDSPIILIGIQDPLVVPHSTRLFPNPVANVATLDYTLLAGAQVKLVLYDITGHEIAVLSDTYSHAGKNHVDLDVKNYAKGMYMIAFILNDIAVKNEKLLIK